MQLFKYMLCLSVVLIQLYDCSCERATADTRTGTPQAAVWFLYIREADGHTVLGGLSIPADPCQELRQHQEQSNVDIIAGHRPSISGKCS